MVYELSMYLKSRTFGFQRKTSSLGYDPTVYAHPIFVIFPSPFLLCSKFFKVTFKENLAQGFGLKI
jgi:hypothetical protein